MTEITERIYGTIIGAAIGDALGAPLEFLPSRPEHLFVRDMVGGGVLKNKKVLMENQNKNLLNLLLMNSLLLTKNLQKK